MVTKKDWLPVWWEVTGEGAGPLAGQLGTCAATQDHSSYSQTWLPLILFVRYIPIQIFWHFLIFYIHALCTVHYFTLILIYILLAIALANPLYIGVKFKSISINVINTVKFRAGNATIILHREQRQRVSACVTRTSSYTRQQATIRPP